MIAFALYAAACFFSMTAVMYGSAMAARWLDARDAAREPATQDEINALAERVVTQVEWSTALDQPRSQTVAYVAEILAELEADA